MIRCSKCVMPTTRPDTHFVDGVCSACISYANRPTIDWDARKAELVALLDRHHGRCIVPSSGGKDSHYQVLKLLELGADVQIVTATTCMLTEIGRRNIDNLAKYAPTIEYTPNMTQRAQLNRMGLEMVGDINWPEHVAIFTVPFKAACALGRPLIFYGENPQNQYGGPPGADQAREITRRWVSEFGGFLGLRVADVVEMIGDMSYYEAPSQQTLSANAIEAHFLGQYIPWDSEHNAQVATEAGMRCTTPTEANFWSFENLDNAMTGIHDYLMYRKYGYGRGAAQISVDVRAGRITREAALAWVNMRDGRYPATYMGVPILQVLDRIGMTAIQFRDICNQYTNWDLFDRASDGSVLLKEAPWNC